MPRRNLGKDYCRKLKSLSTGILSVYLSENLFSSREAMLRFEARNQNN